MALKHGSINITVVKHGTASISTVYHGGTKVFPDTAYQELQTYLYVDEDDDGYVTCRFYNPNNFAVSIEIEIYGETSTGDISGDYSGTIAANSWDGTGVLVDTGAEYYWVSAEYSISGGGYTWSQDDRWD